MSSLGPSTVSSSYNRLLVLPAGGGDGTNLVSLSDGDGVTEFALRISTTDISVPATGKIYLDGGSDTYITSPANDVLLLGRTANTNTNLSLNAKTGVCTYAEYPTGNYVDSGNNNVTFLSSGGPAWFETAKGARGCLISPGGDPWGVALTTNASDAGWSNGYKFVKHSDPRDVLGGFLGYGGGQNAIVRLTMGVAYNSDPGIHYKVSNGFVGIGENDPDAP